MKGHHMKAVGIIRACPYCNTEVQIVVTKRQLKAMLTAMKSASPSEANILCEQLIGRDDKTGEMKT